MSILLLAFIALNVIQRTLSNPQQHQDRSDHMSVNQALRLINELELSGVKICSDQPPLSRVIEVARHKVGLEVGVILTEISAKNLRQILSKIYHPISEERPSETRLLDMIASRISPERTLEDVALDQRDEIIRKIISDGQLTGDIYIRLYCHFNSAVSFASRVLKYARSTLVNLKPLVESLPASNFEFWQAEQLSSFFERELVESFMQTYAHKRYLTSSLERFVSSVLVVEFDKRTRLHRLIHDRIMAIMEAVRLNGPGSIRTETQTYNVFKDFLKEEYEIRRLHRKCRPWLTMKLSFMALAFSGVIIMILTLKLLLDRMRAVRAVRAQRLAEHYGMDEKP